MTVGQYGPEVILNGNVGAPSVSALVNITVKNPDNSAAALFTDTTGATSLGTNVVATDSFGNLTFFAAAGPYKITYTDVTGARTLTVIVYEDTADLSATVAPAIGAVFEVGRTQPVDSTRFGVPVVWIDTTPPAYSVVVLEDAPTTYLSLNGNTTNSGSVAEVYTPTALTYGAGIGDGAQAGVFDGSTTGLEAPQGTGTGFAGCTAFTIEAIVKQPNHTAGQNIGYQLSTYSLSVNTLGKPSVSIQGIGSVTAATALVVDTPTHVAATWDGATLRVYLNGVQSASVAASGTMTNYATAKPRLGTGGADGGAPWLGSLAGIAMYRNAALSAARILAHADSAGLAA